MSPSTVHASDFAEESFTIETERDFVPGDKPKVLRKRDSMQGERQISVDPISISEKSNLHHFIASKSKFLSCSLPNSASSSPKQQSKKKCNNQRQGIARQHSVALANLEKLQEIHLQRSKSCREGRSCQPSIDFDLWSNKNSDRPLSYDSQRRADNVGDEKVARGSFTKGSKEGKSYDETFKCGAMCLFIPGFGKAKAVRSKYEEELEMEMEKETEIQSKRTDIVSHKVSMEKFECGSWRSSAVMNSSDEDGEATSNMFFDLPVELIRSSTVNDTDSVITAGFTFDSKDNQRNIKGVLKNPNVNGSGHSRNSCESSITSRHVRFSTSSPTSSPTCVTPRLRKARDEFTVFLEAQSG